jgi:translocation and assembly module TamA
MLRTGLGSAVLLSLLMLGPPSAAADVADVKVVVELSGLSGEMRRNALGSMMLTAAADQGRMSPVEARRLARRARADIERALQPFGHYRPLIRDQLDTDGEPWKARYVVEPGPPVRLTAVDVQVRGPGADLAKIRDVVRAFPLRPGDRLQHAPYEALKSGLSRAAAAGGYLDARFAVHRLAVDPAADTARVEVVFETGERYAFGPVRFQQDVLDSTFVRSFVLFHPGEPYNADSLISMQSALVASRYFSRVEIEPRRDQAVGLVVPIDVRLEQARGLRWSLGAGYGTDTGFEGRVALELRRLNRRGHRATLDVLASQYRNSVGAQYHIPHLLGRTRLLTFSVALADEETDAQSSRGGSVGVTLTPNRRHWQDSYGLFFQRQSFTVGADQGNPDLLFPEVSLRHVESDDRIQPRNGHRVAFVLRGAHQQVASDATFLRFDAQSKVVTGAGRHRRMIGRAEVGATWTHDFHALPPDMRYFAGGAASVRAYGYQDLGPQDATGEPVGGERLLFASIEFEQRLLGPWGAAVFCDVGNALERFGDPLASGAGVGMRWLSPVGMVRLDVAWALDRPSSGQVQFSMGPDL